MPPEITGTPTPTPAATTPPAPAPSQTPPASPSPAPAPVSGPGSSGTPGSGTPNPTPAAPSPAPITPATPPQIDFDTQFRQRLGMSLDQAQLLLSMGYRAYQQQGQAAPAQVPAQPTPAQQAANIFGLPQFDMNLLNFVGRDDQGRLQLLPGAPPDAAIRVQEYQEKLRQVQQQFWSDPMKFLGPVIQRQAEEIAGRVFQGQFQQTQHQQFARQTLQANEGWLYERDASGQTQHQFNPATGRQEPVLSAAGRAYRQFVVEAHQAGIQDPARQHQYAITSLQNQLMQARLAQLQAPQQQQQANGQFLQQAAQQTPPPAAGANPVVPVQQPKTLRQAMLDQMNANGITDDVLRQQMANPRAA